MAKKDWAARYGSWAVVAGASEGLGGAFADALAARGLKLILLARRSAQLERKAAELRGRHDAEVIAHRLDLGEAGLATRLEDIVGEREIGVAIYNAAFAPKGELLSRSLEELLSTVDVNVRGPLVFARTMLPPMVARGRGALVLMSSLAGLQGSPRLAAYAASKAFNTVLGESLWGELHGSGVDVLTSCAGAIRTPGYHASSQTQAPGILEPSMVAEQTLNALGRGPRVIPGGLNKVASLVMGNLLPRRAAISIMGKSTRSLREGAG